MARWQMVSWHTTQKIGSGSVVRLPMRKQYNCIYAIKKKEWLNFDSNGIVIHSEQWIWQIMSINNRDVVWKRVCWLIQLINGKTKQTILVFSLIRCNILVLFLPQSSFINCCIYSLSCSYRNRCDIIYK